MDTPHSLPVDTDSLPVITVKKRKALPFFSRHPWMYASAIASVSDAITLGEQVVVRSHDGQLIGTGLYNPHSKIRVRLYDWGTTSALDSTFWAARLRAAIELRKRLYADTPAWNACRLISSEADGMSGLTVDRYDDWLVVQWTSSALQSRSADILPLIQQELQPRGIWLRTERGIRELEGLEIEDGLLAGEEPPQPLFIEEHGVRYGVDLQSGQKTGFYFDQRETRQVVHRLAAGARVLDVCTYTGSFAINAAMAPKCRQVHAIDSSASALELARRNAELNSVAAKITFEQSDMFDALERIVEAGEQYDLIILDPPKMARSRGGLQRAIQGYLRLNRLGMQALTRNGVLVTCSCSGHVSRADFEQILASAALESGRRVQILEERGQSHDHPVVTSCLESAYLKAFVCRVE